VKSVPDTVSLRGLVESFEDGTIDNCNFSHPEHLFVIWSLVRSRGTLPAVAQFEACLRRITEPISWEQNGQKIEIYDFLYYFTVNVRDSSGHGFRKEERVVAQTIAKVSHESPVSFQLSPKSVLNAVSEKFVGEKSIQFVDLPEFARKFSLQCEDEFAIKKIFDLEVREELLNDPGWSIEADGKHLVVYRDQELYKVEAWPELAERAIEFSRLLKVRDGIIR